ncbi:MAG: MurR/RpiR family transcriptional regulator [Burkholderiales bacterium]|nr:MurR/RpiR family transcriptional regulator [Burkholderiales bacterium]
MPAAATYEELKDAIARTYPGMSKQLQRIARFALEKPHDLALGTVAVVAEATEVQPSAMIRFANALGYRGFSDMQQVFRGHLVQRSASYRERIDQLRRSQLNGQRAPAGVLHQIVGDAIGELGHLEEGIREADLKAAVKLVAAADRIHVLAQRRAFPVAAYLAYALGQLELKTHLLDGAGGMLQDNLGAIGAQDVLLVASFRNYSPEVVEAAEACAARGVAVISITDGPLSPLVALSRVSFQLADDSSKAFRSLVAPLCLAQALVVSTGHHLADKPPPRSARKTKASRTS